VIVALIIDIPFLLHLSFMLPQITKIKSVLGINKTANSVCENIINAWYKKNSLHLS